MSATINCREFADYFAVPVQNKMNPAYVFEVAGQPHSIEEFYLGDLEHVPYGRVRGRWSSGSVLSGEWREGQSVHNVTSSGGCEVGRQSPGPGLCPP